MSDRVRKALDAATKAAEKCVLEEQKASILTTIARIELDLWSMERHEVTFGSVGIEADAAESKD